MQNPWADRWEQNYQDGVDHLNDAAIRSEAQEARGVEMHPCTNEACTEYNTLAAYYRPGVGGWWCGTCGEYSMV